MTSSARPLPGDDGPPADLRAALAAFPDARLRAVRDTDADGLIALVAEAYAQYPGCVLDLPGVDADLVAPASHAATHDVDLRVVEDGGRIVASVGIGPPSTHALVELKRLYVASSHRRRGLAAGLVRLVEHRAATLGAAGVELWTDTRFGEAHRLYERLGYQADGRTRELSDPSETTEYHFSRLFATAPGAGSSHDRGP